MSKIFHSERFNYENARECHPRVMAKDLVDVAVNLTIQLEMLTK